MGKVARYIGTGLFLALTSFGGAQADDPNGVKVAWLGTTAEQSPVDDGLAGLKLAIADDNSSGRFIKQSFSLEAVPLPADGDAEKALVKLAESGIRFAVVNLPPAILAHAAANPKLARLTLFNAGSTDDRLRAADCRANVLHTMPSRLMLTDALTQVLMKKDWKKWLLIVGPDPADQAYADSLRRSARKFGAKLVAERNWTFTRDTRHTAESEIAAMTQDADYDVVMVADEAGNFGDQIPFNTWRPRPVAGTQGLVAAAWHPAYDKWGAEQLHNRFNAVSGRPMTPTDFAAWEAGRALGEAAMRIRSTDADRLNTALRADDFALAAYKGRSLNFRRWDGQLRQPIVVAWAKATVAIAPQDGYLHPVTDLDTLGIDKGESPCVMR